MSSWIKHLHELDRTHTSIVGGKGAKLGEQSRLDGAGVPPGFCITTQAFARAVADAPDWDERLEALARLDAGDLEGIRDASAALRDVVERCPIPAEIGADIVQALSQHGTHHPYAVRSSATAEDSPTASFAGLHETELGVVGAESILQHVRRCWASLFSERAVVYRIHQRIDHRAVRMAVVVQRLIAPDASGVAFTADPISGHRRIVSIEACLGLGESLVSGRADADVYQVREETIVGRTIATKHAQSRRWERGERRGRRRERREEQPTIRALLCALSLHLCDLRVPVLGGGLWGRDGSGGRFLRSDQMRRSGMGRRARAP